MQFGFDTESEMRGKAALLLYAMYRSRDTNSALNGLDTWSRFASFTKGAALKSTTTAQFCDQFCRMSKVPSIKPGYLKSDDGMVMMPDGSIIQSPDVKDFKISIIEDNKLLPLFEKESQLLVMLVRERIQREKLNVAANVDGELESEE